MRVRVRVRVRVRLRVRVRVRVHAHALLPLFVFAQAFEEARRRHFVDEHAGEGEEDDGGLYISDQEVDMLAARQDALFKILKLSHTNGRCGLLQ